jgi:hypothetical protein
MFTRQSFSQMSFTERRRVSKDWDDWFLFESCVSFTSIFDRVCDSQMIDCIWFWNLAHGSIWELTECLQSSVRVLGFFHWLKCVENTAIFNLSLFVITHHVYLHNTPISLHIYTLSVFFLILSIISKSRAVILFRDVAHSGISSTNAESLSLHKLTQVRNRLT